MCSKPKAPKKVEEKPIQYLANPFLDGLGIGADAGRNALRIDLAPAGGKSAPMALGAGGVGGGPKRGPARGALPVIPGLLIPNRAGRGGGAAPRYNLQ